MAATDREAHLEALLAEARLAWRRKLDADTHLARLAGYKALNKDMRADQHRHRQTSTECGLILSRLLGGA